MIAVDGENYDKEGKSFPKIIEKLGKILKHIIPQLRICRDDVDGKNESKNAYKANQRCIL